MYKFYFRACLFITLLIFPYVIFAAGLGKLTLNSALGQPLKAEIDLVAVRNDEMSSLTAGLASQEAFRQAGISYKPFFSTLDIAIETRANGDAYIRITSPNSINEPFLSMLVELSWASGRLMREYTVLLDPIEPVSSKPVAPTINDAPVAVETYPVEPEVLASPVVEKIKPEPVAILKSVAKETYGPVSPGDTLSKIAMQVSPQGVNLNQMLIALFRANQTAFIGNNINLLKVGEVLRIPSSNEIANISESEASAEVKIQVADWRNYKNELASVSTESPATHTRKQVDTGKIVTTVEGEIVALEAKPDEVLRLSGGVHMDDKLGSAGAKSDSPQERMRMIEEDSIARSLALIEANERIELLERNIQNLQRLLELKDPALAQAQKQAEDSNKKESIVDLMPDSIDDILPSLEGVVDAAEQELNELFAADVTSDETNATFDLAEPSTEASIMDQVMDNVAYIAGIVVFMLLSALIAMKIRRKKSANENEVDSDELNLDSSSSISNKVASVAAVSSLVSQAEIDAAQASEDMQKPESEEEINAFADVSVKEDLDEMDLDFSQDEDATEDESVIAGDSMYGNEDLSEQNLEHEFESGIDLELDDLADKNIQSDNDELSIDVSEREVIDAGEDSFANEIADTAESDNELAFTDEAIASLEEAIKSERKAIAIASEIDSDGTDSEQQDNEIDFEFNLDSNNLADNPESSDKSGRESEQSAEHDISFDLDLDLAAEAIDENDTSDRVASDEGEAQNQEVDTDLSIDFPAEPETSLSASEAMVDEPDVTVTEADFNLDVDDTLAEPTEIMAADNGVMNAEPEAQDERWHDIETKIDLAKAYIEMDDSEGAREILEEVTQEGDAGQQEKAKMMLENLT